MSLPAIAFKKMLGAKWCARVPRAGVARDVWARKGRLPTPARGTRAHHLFAPALILASFLLGTSVPVPTAQSEAKAKTFDQPAPKKDPCKLARARLKLEEELRVALRDLRRAIDGYKTACEYGQVGPLDRKADDQCYPPNLETLVTGIVAPNRAERMRFLRRIPKDPLTGRAEWGLRSSQDEPGSTGSWGGQHVFDVYSKSTKTALDGTKYLTW